jgi:alpha/beta superfamily hydrolase
METKISFYSDGHKLEGLLKAQSPSKGVVISHPHPLFGGDMHDRVVESMAAAYLNQGFTTLRFNFRGVGQSRGRYGEGIGERRDVLAALSYLENTGVTALDLAGYSFGAWVNFAVTPKHLSLARLIMVSPPVSLISFDSLPANQALQLVITGNRDDIAPASQIKKMVPVWNPAAQFAVIDSADHFFSGCLDRLTSILLAHLQSFEKMATSQNP